MNLVVLSDAGQGGDRVKITRKKRQGGSHFNYTWLTNPVNVDNDGDNPILVLQTDDPANPIDYIVAENNPEMISFDSAVLDDPDNGIWVIFCTTQPNGVTPLDIQVGASLSFMDVLFPGCASIATTTTVGGTPPGSTINMPDGNGQANPFDLHGTMTSVECPDPEWVTDQPGFIVIDPVGVTGRTFAAGSGILANSSGVPRVAHITVKNGNGTTAGVWTINQPSL